VIPDLVQGELAGLERGHGRTFGATGPISYDRRGPELLLPSVSVYTHSGPG